MLWLQEQKCCVCRNINVLVAGTQILFTAGTECYGCRNINAMVAGT